jgi:hypothetical protein
VNTLKLPSLTGEGDGGGSSDLLKRARLRLSGFFPPNIHAQILAQWLHESARGTSILATQHFNLAGLKYREELKQVSATPIRYKSHFYAKFPDINSFARGYEVFISRSVYNGWREHTGGTINFIKFLVSKGYAEDPDYVAKVLKHLPEARRILKMEVTSKWIPAHSTNYATSRGGKTPTIIVLHYTAESNYKSAVSWFQNPKSKVSAHYVVGREGELVQMVREEHKAFHARHTNSYSIGIECAAAAGEKLTPPQEKVLIGLLKDVMARWNIPKSKITGHRFVGIDTSCPGSLFKTEEDLRTWVNQNL